MFKVNINDIKTTSCPISITPVLMFLGQYRNRHNIVFLVNFEHFLHHFGLLLTYYTTFSSVSIIDFEHVFVS